MCVLQAHLHPCARVQLMTASIQQLTAPPPPPPPSPAAAAAAKPRPTAAGDSHGANLAVTLIVYCQAKLQTSHGR